MDPCHRLMLVASPSSSEAAAGSLQNTPETQPTAFSPEELRSEQHGHQPSVPRPTYPPPFNLHLHHKPGPSNYVGQSSASSSVDPFVASSTAAGAGAKASQLPKLSPAASSFTPSAGSQNLNTATHAIKHRDDYDDYRTVTPRPNTAFQSPADAKAFAKFGDFSTDENTSRYLAISQVSRNTTLAELEAFFHVSHGHCIFVCRFINPSQRSVFPSLKHIGANEIGLTGIVYASFSSVQDSVNAYTKVKSLRTDWGVHFIGTLQYFNMDHPGVKTPALVWEGQVSIIVKYYGPASHFNPASMGHIVKEVLENYGKVKAMEAAEVTSPTVVFRAEFYDSAAISRAWTSLQGFKIAVSLVVMIGIRSG